MPEFNTHTVTVTLLGYMYIIHVLKYVNDQHAWVQYTYGHGHVTLIHVQYTCIKVCQ